ncbi:MAG TPA: hypothetical protein PKY25_01760 [Bacilli bacterium]|nr:hypothetical protein [Bacilli bacterium]
MENRKKIKIISGILAGVLVITSAGYELVTLLKQKGFKLETDSESYTASTIIDTTEDNENSTIKTDVQELFDCINSNQNLNKQEKEFFKKFYPFISKYYKYLQMDELKQILSTIDLKYKNDVNINIEGNNNIAEYNHVKNTITIYFVNSIDEYNNLAFDTNILEHEIFHVLSCTKSNEKNIAFEEGMTRMLQKEFFSCKAKENLPELVAICQMLCELITPEKMISAYLNHANMDILENELLILDQDKSKSKAFINNINTFFYILRNSQPDSQYTDFAIIILNEMIDQYNYYYKLKYNIDIKDDAYLINFISLLNKRKEINKNNEYYNNHKAYSVISEISISYFNKKSKNMKIAYENFNEDSISNYSKIVVSSENRYNNSKQGKTK